MNVDDVVAEKVAAARRRAEANKERRAEFAENRARGVAARHATKTARVARQSPVEMPVPACAAHCPACRRERVVRPVGAATVRGTPVRLVQCADPACGLVWAVRPASAAAA